jgi:hypothetical protein
MALIGTKDPAKYSPERTNSMRAQSSSAVPNDQHLAKRRDAIHRK